MDWWKGAVFYQVYPRSFSDSVGDGVGDLRGLKARLSYIADLGADAVWLSPVFRSPMKDFGYDVSDYCDIDPVFGTLADFAAVVAEAHRLGLKLVIDQVWSHTSDAHPWFQDSLRRGDKDDWYVWADAKPDGSPPNNWLSVFGGPAWTWSSLRRQYYLHNFLSGQPDLNFHNPAVRAAILEVARFWLDRGVDGFRLDVANYYAHDPLLRDNPPAPLAEPASTPYGFQRHLYDRSQPAALEFLHQVRALLDGYGDKMAVGEIYDDEMLARQREYTDGPGRLHTAYSFFFLEAQAATPGLFRQALSAWEGARGWPAWSLGNHDAIRFPTRLAGDDPRRIKLLLAVLLTLRGTPFLFQGDELGLPHGEVPFERLQDPFAIAAYAGGSGRDGARTPFPWAADAWQGGFSDAPRTWLPLDPRHRALAVDRQEGDPRSVLSFTRALLKLRRAHPDLAGEALELVEAPEGLLAYRRGSVLCVFDLGGKGGRIAAVGRLLDSGLEATLEGESLSLPPWGGALVVSRQK